VIPQNRKLNRSVVVCLVEVQLVDQGKRSTYSTVFMALVLFQWNTCCKLYFPDSDKLYHKLALASPSR